MKSKGIFTKSIVSVLFFIIISTFFVACTPSHGIPNGTYHPRDENGEFPHQGLEYAWQIENNKAEYLYEEFSILEEDGKIFFYIEEKATLPTRKYEAEYDKETKILTVYMPSDMPKNNPSSEEIVAFQFKKKDPKKYF